MKYHCLVDEVKAIRDLPDEVSLSRPEAYKQVIEGYRPKSGVLRQRLDKGVMVVSEFDALAERVGGLKALHPNRYDEETFKRLRDMRVIIGGDFGPYSSADSLIINPVGSGGILAFCFETAYLSAVGLRGISRIGRRAVANFTDDLDKEKRLRQLGITRRDFLKGSLGTAALGGVSGGFLGGFASLGLINNISVKRELAVLVDDVVKEAYGI
ncbi:MAG: twin-arginine translocation signal domain-containing protein [Candidatus Pacearchaeota archaeon]|jgi:hypothetical protein